MTNQLTFPRSTKDAYPIFRNLLPRKKDLLPSALLILAYIASARLTLEFLPPSEIAPALIWPPVGITLAFMFLFGYRMIAAIFIAVVTHMVARDAALSTIIASVVINTTFPILGVYTMRRFDYHPSLVRLRDAYTMLIVGSLVSAVFPVLLLIAQFFTGTMTGEDLTNRFLRIWGGVVFSAIILTPLITSWAHDWRIDVRGRKLIELLAATSSAVAVSVFIFLTPYAQTLGGLVFLVILLPHLWLALRFETKYTTFGLCIMAAISIVGVVMNISDSDNPLGQRLYTVELFMVFLAFIVLILSALVEERRRAAVGLKQHIDQLEIALKQIRAQDKAKTEFLAILGHELRNPLAPIVTALETLRLKGVTLQESATFDLINDRLRAIRRLLDDLLDISRISHNKLRLQKEATDLHTISLRAIHAIQERLEENQQTVRLEYAQNAFLLEADPVRLEQILRNLLSNAAKFSQKGGEIVISAQQRQDRVELRVVDTGVGIEPTMLEKVFEPFLQLEGGHRGNEGLGIGLYITRRLVETHGGSIRAESKGKGHGTEFILELPLSRQKAKESLIPSESKKMTNTSILVVDDNKPAANSLGRLLELTGNSVNFAYTGHDAIEKTLAWKPDVVILDIGLPDMTGYEVAKSLRGSNFKGIIIALTGYGQEEDKRRALSEGFDFHLVKPVGIREIQSVLVTT